MKKKICVLTFVLLFINSLVFAQGAKAFQRKPTIHEVEPVLKAYLVATQEGNCPGGVTVEELSSIRIGDYDNTLGGWPVYSKNKVICRSGKSTFTYDNTKHSANTITAVVRRTNLGKVECFTPEIFKQAFTQFEQATKKMGTYIEKGAEKHKKEEKVKEGLIKMLISTYTTPDLADEGRIDYIQIDELTIQANSETTLEGISDIKELKTGDRLYVIYYPFVFNRAKHIKVLK